MPARGKSARPDPAGDEHRRIVDASVKHATVHIQLAHRPTVSDRWLAISEEKLPAVHVTEEREVEGSLADGQECVRLMREGDARTRGAFERAVGVG